MQPKCQKKRARPRTSFDGDTRVCSMERRLEGNGTPRLDTGGNERAKGSSTGLKLSRSCPKLVDMEKTSSDIEAGDDVRSTKNGNLKSHPLTYLEKETKQKRRGLSFVKLFNVLTLGLGTVVCYVGWRRRILRLTPTVITGFCIGMYSGLKYSKNYQRNIRVKERNARILKLALEGNESFQIGAELEGGGALLSANPLSEKVEYITRVLKLMWPYYEPNICKWIVEFLNPTLEEVKPPVIRRIRLSRLTFGSIPFDITEVTVVKETDNEFVIDAGVRWYGNAHVAMTIDVKGGGVLRPRFEKFNFYGITRISFTPLISRFPGFGAMTLSFPSTPIIDFELSVGQSMLSVVAEQVRQFLSTFVTDHVFGNVLVWPARVVIPILPERQRGRLNHLRLHTRGVLRVVVVEANGLAFGESCNGFRTDIKPFVVLETVPLQPLTTKVLPDGQVPIWNEEHYLKVQELDQTLKVEIFDDHYDPVLSAFSTLKRHGRKIGSVSIPLIDLKPGRMTDNWYKLVGTEEDMTRAVRSKHHGQDILSEMWYLDKRSCNTIGIRLRLTYMPVEDLRQGRLLSNMNNTGTFMNSHHGLLFVRLLRAYNLANVDFLSLSDPFCQLTVGTRPPKRSRTIKNTLDPKWGESFEWFNVSVKDKLCIEVLSEGTVIDIPIGYAEIGILAIAFDCERDCRTIDATFTLTDGAGDVHLEIEWVPLDSNLFRKRQLKNMSNPSSPLLKAASRGQLFLRLLWAVGLPNVDYIGVSDPYCIIQIQGSERKSSVVWDNLNPKWDEEFWWESVKYTDILEIHLWDKGTVLDSFLGRVDVPIKRAIETPGVVKERTYSVIKKDGSRHGRLTFQILWTPSNGTGRREMLSSVSSWPEPIADPPPSGNKRLFGNFFCSA